MILDMVQSDKRTQKLVLLDGRFYPVDAILRANRERGDTRDCPRPVRVVSSPIHPREFLEGDQGNVKKYCWNSCEIYDCPTYQMER
jgi:hypothetical protein